MKFKNSFWGYFQFFYGLTGSRLFIGFGLGILVSVLDGISLAMFMPLLQATGDASANKSQEALGHLHYLTDFIQTLGFSLTINTVLSILVFIFILKGILKFFQQNYQVNTRHKFMTSVRNLLLDKLEGISYKGFLKLDAGRIHNTLTGEVSKLFSSMNYYFDAAQCAVMLTTYIVLAFLANFQFALLVAAGAAASNFLYRKIYIACKRIALQLSQHANSFNSYIVQAIHNYKYLKSTNSLSSFSGKIRAVISETERLNRKVGVYNAITLSVKEPIIMLVVVLVIQIQLHYTGADLTSILLSLLLFYRSLNYLMSVQSYWQSFIQASAGITTITSIVTEMEVNEEVNGTQPFQSFHNRITLRNLGFSYGANRVLNNINVNIQKNKTIALVGESGSGKTTLANIISGLVPPDEGEISVDNVPLSKYNLSSYRNKIGYISQEPVIFNDNIFNNVTFWDEPSAENVKRFWYIVDLASLTDFISGLQQKELTPLGDNGTLVSGGQKQRISIARELYKKVDILILDEATSALDSETEKVVQNNIEKLHGNYTIVIIAHRLSTIKKADTIYLLDKGKVLENGNFDQMLTISNRFKQMVALQEM